MKFNKRIEHAWNAFKGNDERWRTSDFPSMGMSSSIPSGHQRRMFGTEKTIIASVYNRIALDAAATDIVHAVLDEDDRFEKQVNSGLNQCLTLRANIDQNARAFIHDIVLSLMDEGVVAIVPVDTTSSITEDSNAFDINSMRVGKIQQWYPRHVEVEVYNDNTGMRENLILPKNTIGIVENPLYAVINEPNSTMQRLKYKLHLLDIVDEQSGSGKLNILVQLPYAIKSDARQQQADKRLQNLEMQLSENKYGIAYIDSTEKITQLNRPIDNNLQTQVEYLTNLLYSQLGITQTILDGTADERTMLNYYNRTVEPIVAAIVDEMSYKFLTKTARTQRQIIRYFRDPFKMIPINDLAEISDKFTRNEIASSNEMRSIIGWKPSKDPNADELRNKNLNQNKEALLQKQKEPLLIDNKKDGGEKDAE